MSNPTPNFAPIYGIFPVQKAVFFCITPQKDVHKPLTFSLNIEKLQKLTDLHLCVRKPAINSAKRRTAALKKGVRTAQIIRFWCGHTLFYGVNGGRLRGLGGGSASQVIRIKSISKLLSSSLSIT